MFILVLSQRDIKHPLSGGAEFYIHNALRRIARELPVVHLSVGHPSLNNEEMIDGIRYIRRGRSLASLVWHGFRYYLKNKNDVALVIDHSNTHQFFTFLYARPKRVLFIHQLTQEIWVHFFGSFPGRILWLLEEMLLRLSRGQAVTVSDSTRGELTARGFKDIQVCPEGNIIKNLALPEIDGKKDYLVYAGRLVPYKRVEDAIYVAAKAGRKLYIIGRGPEEYRKRLEGCARGLCADCVFCGYLPREQKDAIIRNARLLIMPSVREGWGLVITESANLGTPSLVYGAPGVIEAVDYGRAGFVAPGMSAGELLETYMAITPERYVEIREKAFDYSLRFTWERTSGIFAGIVKVLLAEKQSEKGWGCVDG